jgi:integrase-like protein
VDGKLYFGPTKTYGSRSVALPSFLRDHLAEHLAHHVGNGAEALVFTAPDGSPLRNSAFHKRFWTPAVQTAGLQALRPHDLRHTAAALLIAQGAHPKAIQSHLGHSSITVTLGRYGHLFPDDMDRLAAGLEKTYRDALASPARPGRAPKVAELCASRCGEIGPDRHLSGAEGVGLEPTSPFGQRFSRPSACQLA